MSLALEPFLAGDPGIVSCFNPVSYAEFGSLYMLSSEPSNSPLLHMSTHSATDATLRKKAKSSGTRQKKLFTPAAIVPHFTVDCTFALFASVTIVSPVLEDPIGPEYVANQKKSVTVNANSNTA